MLQDLRFALRTFGKNPGFAMVAILALALGIGANAALFSVINAVLLKPLPYTHSERLIRIFETFQPSGYGSVSTPNFLDWRKQNHAFDHLEACTFSSLNLESNGEPERIPSILATAGIFDMLGTKPIQGRTFLPDEDQPGKPHVVVISERLWRRRFGADPNLLGSQITIDGQSATVIGIMPASFQFPAGSFNRTLWMPLQFTEDQLKDRGSHWMAVVGRLRPGITMQMADSDMKRIAAGLAEQFPGQQKGRSVWMQSFQNVIAGNLRPVLLMLMGSVGFVLLIACAKCCQSSAGTRGGANAGSGRPGGVGREPIAINPPVPDGEHPAGLSRWSGRGVSSRCGSKGPGDARGRSDPLGQRRLLGWNRVPVFAGYMFGCWSDLRSGSRVSQHGLRFAGWFEGRRTEWGRGNTERESSKRAGDWRVCSSAGASDRSRIVDADLPRT
jgi:MacB-like periplasmic core domain